MNTNYLSLKIVIIVMLLTGLISPATAQSTNKERIIDYHSDIVVHEDSTMTVTETIKVWCNGYDIRRGIYRDFPTKYSDKNGNRYVVGFEVLEVLRDGSPDDYDVKGLMNGKRVYIGNEDYFLPTGKEYTYTLKYKTNRQLAFLDDHDELYWNVTGNGWLFDIEHASALVTFPTNATESDFTLQAWTGRQDETGNAYRSDIRSGKAYFETTGTLDSHEGLTISVKFPKGIITEPTSRQKLMWFLRDNRIYLAGIVGLLLMLLYLVPVHIKIGIDPPAGTIIPAWEIPENLSPCAMRYIIHMGYDNKCFTASVINLAVKGLIHISEKGSKYSLKRLFPLDELKTRNVSRDEKIVAENMLKEEEILLDKENHKEIASAISRVNESLSKRYGKKYIKTNAGYVTPAFIIGLIAAIVMFVTHASMKMGPIAIAFAIVMTIVYVVLLAVYTHLLKKPTPKGREMMDKIEGFKMYLATAEQDRLNILNPPEKTPELFEKYLPYALALDVENEWNDQFSAVLARAAEQGDEYSPSWYSGRHYNSFHNRSFASAISSSVSSAISSSSTAPGGGSGGGGSSGGGGGGGGGGGW